MNVTVLIIEKKCIICWNKVLYICFPQGYICSRRVIFAPAGLGSRELRNETFWVIFVQCDWVAFTIMIVIVGGLKDNTSSRSVAMSSSIIVGGSWEGWGRGRGWAAVMSFLLMDLSGSPSGGELVLSPLNETWWNGDKDNDDCHDRRRTLDAS